MKRSRKYAEDREKVVLKGKLDLDRAVEMLFTLKKAKFDETVELAIRLGVDPKKSDQQVRGSFSLPHGIGKTKRVIVFADGDKAKEAEKAGATEVGTKDLVDKIKGGWLDFDVAIATPDMMKFVKVLGRDLGPKGLMPNPKTGTVTEHVANAVKEFAAGKVDFKNDEGGNVHVPVGKRSFEKDKLVENIQAFIEYVQTLRPSTSKGQFIQSAALSSTMSPGIGLRI
ncbi:MAG: 50S ribosomal protein L1 [Planctomycetota bacterium]|nr:MAG: 50S ribosomal protein L1 [Planctomycetota bacterium]